MIAPAPEEIVEIDRLMRAVKIADAKMNDAALQRAAVVFGPCDLGRQRA